MSQTYVYFLADCMWKRIPLRQFAQMNSGLCLSFTSYQQSQRLYSLQILCNGVSQKLTGFLLKWKEGPHPDGEGSGCETPQPKHGKKLEDIP